MVTEDSRVYAHVFYFLLLFRGELLDSKQYFLGLFCFGYRLEAAKDDYRIRCEELEKEISELRQQNDELTTLADEAQSLKDEIDVLR